jgi:hypothetical protein
VPTNLNDVLVQNKRWMSGMLAVGVSRRHSPLLRASLLQAMAYAYFGFVAAAFASSLLQHLEEVCVAKRRIALRTWWKEQRFWVLNALTGQLFGCVSAAEELLAARGLAVTVAVTSGNAAGPRVPRVTFSPCALHLAMSHVGINHATFGRGVCGCMQVCMCGCASSLC